MADSDDNGDPFMMHFQREMLEDTYLSLINAKHKILRETWPSLGKLIIKLLSEHDEKNKFTVLQEETDNNIKLGVPPKRVDSLDWDQLYIKSQIQNNITNAFIKYCGSSMNSFHSELLSIISYYYDLYFTEENMVNRKDLRFIYTLHAINHALKTRLKIIHHNVRLTSKTDVPDELRDQGLVRPKVLILVPFRNSALEIVQIMASILLPNEKDNIINKKRFMEEFSGNEISLSQKSSRPDDFKHIFSGNIDDNFKIGIKVTKKSLKLYADFYSSDIIVASPLGLRLIIGAEGETDRDYDFLASIEVLIIDQTEMFLMQNWDHVLHIMNHLHQQPKESHGTDFARVRLWAINKWSRYYCQTLVFASQPLPEISALVTRCKNYFGSVRTSNPIKDGTISQVIVRLPQVFYRIKELSATETIDARFELFVQKILPQYQDNSSSHVLVYIPSYFDFVRLRNYFISEMISFSQICEYTEDGKVAEARDKFFHQEVNFLLYSERFHFYNRRKIRGIRHIIFYQIPTFANFYSEMCNLMQTANQNHKHNDDINMTIVAVYSKYDITQLSGIVTTNRAVRMFSDDKDVYMFSTDDL